MGSRHLRGDVQLLREGVDLVREFGLPSVDRLLHVAEFLERGVYESRSLRVMPEGVGFTLLNPPLRVGAFSSLRLGWDGAPVPSERAYVRAEGHSIERPLSDITAAKPIELRPGERVGFRLAGVRTDPGSHRVRLELQNIAVPPLVWFEFTDTIGEALRA
jgi:hypothetical protein